MNINIEYKLPIINGFVKVPGEEITKPTYLTPQNVLDAIPGATIGTFITDTAGMTPQAASTVRGYDDPLRPQRFVVLPSFETTGMYPSDWFATLRAL